MSAGPRIAVIVPCYRDGELLPDTVASVREREPVELVVVDDGSDDETTLAALRKLESDGVRVIRHGENRGQSEARATGLQNTRAPYVFPLDSDDLAEPGSLGRMADVLDEHPEADVCFGDYLEFGSSELVRAVPPAIDPYRLAYTNEYPVSALFRRTILDAVGGWPGIKGYEDWHLWMTLAERGTTGVHLGPGILTYRRRIHGERLLAASKRSHSNLYARLREDHPRLFADIAEHRSRSELGPLRKLLYPVVYGRRRRFWWERRAKALLDRAGVWTLRR